MTTFIGLVFIAAVVGFIVWNAQKKKKQGDQTSIDVGNGQVNPIPAPKPGDDTSQSDPIAR